MRTRIADWLAPWLLLATPALAASPCSELGGGTVIGASTVLLASEVGDGAIIASDGQKQEGLPPFCRVVARACAITGFPASSSRYGCRSNAAGTARSSARVNGGFAGTVRSAALAGGLKRGYAVANTDMGTYPAGFAGMGYDAGNGRPDAVRDWGHRATHEMALLTKAITRRFYGRDAQHSYFAGCSTGGHQALTEAQRYPEDYDAILAGAPGHNRTHPARDVRLVFPCRAPAGHLDRP
jgi:feruloyl esterase